MLAKTVFCALSVCALFLTSLETAHARELRFLSVSCCNEGFQFDSPFLTISIVDGDVDIDSPIGSVSVSDEGVVVDSPLLKVDTRERVKVEVAGGKLMTLTKGENGYLMLTIGKGKAQATVVIDEGGHKALPAGDEVVVDFADPSGAIAVDCGEGGKIVDLKTEGPAKASVKIGNGEKVALVDLSGGDGKKKSKKKKVNITEGSGKVDYGDEDLRKPEVRETDGAEVDQEFRTESDSFAVVRVKGTRVIRATVEEIS